MSKFEIKINKKKFEEELNKKVDEIVRKRQEEIIVKRNRENEIMSILSQNAETMLEVFLDKYNKGKNYSIQGDVSEFPDYIRFSIKDNMETLKLYGYISNYSVFITGGWVVILAPEALQYFEKKGSREELFEELADSEKKLLKEIIEVEDNNEDISEYLKEKIENDSKDVVRNVIGTLKSNGLITVNWADDIIYYATLTQAGRTYFEREKKYEEKLSKLSSNTYNINNLTANNSNLIMGDVINSTLNIDNSVAKIEQMIEEKCNNEDDKKVLYELLEETKEIVENMNDSKHIYKRKGFLKKLTEHFDKHNWFYAEIVGFLGQAVLKLLGGD